MENPEQDEGVEIAERKLIHRKSSLSLELESSSPLVLHKTEGFGNYYVAGRRIEPGELVFEESAISVSPYGSSDYSPFCLSCYKDLAFSQKCKICRWPICNEHCSSAPQHSKYECQILAKNKVQYKQNQCLNEYLAIETLRCLLIRRDNKNVQKWKQIQSLEPHMGPRSDHSSALTQMFYVVNFILDRCNLADEFDDMTVLRTLGIVCINTFSGFTYTGRYVSLLFARASFFNHDCTPNTIRRFSEEIDIPEPGGLNFSIQVFAARPILPGEVISTNYGDVTAGIIDRGSFLRDHYYFTCDCHRCRLELFDEIQCSLC